MHMSTCNFNLNNCALTQYMYMLKLFKQGIITIIQAIQLWGGKSPK